MSASQDGLGWTVTSILMTAPAILVRTTDSALTMSMDTPASASRDSLARVVSTLWISAQRILARTEAPALMRRMGSNASVGLDSPVALLATLRMMSVAPDPATPQALWSVWTWTTGLSVTVEMDTLASSARPMSMIVSRHPAEMVASVRIELGTMSVSVPRAGSERIARRMRRVAERRLVRTTPCVSTCSRITSAPVPPALMAKSVRPHPRDVLETRV